MICLKSNGCDGSVCGRTCVSRPGAHSVNERREEGTEGGRESVSSQPELLRISARLRIWTSKRKVWGSIPSRAQSLSSQPELLVKVGIRVRVSATVGDRVKVGIRVKLRIEIRIRVRVRVRVRVMVRVRIRIKVSVRVRVRITFRFRVRVRIRIKVRVRFGARIRIRGHIWFDVFKLCFLGFREQNFRERCLERVLTSILESFLGEKIEAILDSCLK